MAFFSYNKLWEIESDNIVSKRKKLQDMNIIQLKLEVHENYKKDEKITTNFEAFIDSYVINKAYLVEKINKTDGHLSLLGKDYNEFKIHYNEQSVEEILIQRAVKTTTQILFDKTLIDGFANADKVLTFFVCYKT